MTSRTKSSILNPNETAPCTLIKGNSPLIIAGPHNGHLVPEALHDDDHPLGLHASCFDPKSPFKRHEACDWGVAELFTALQELESTNTQKHTYISGHYSRLVSDLSRPPQNSMAEHSSENENDIPGNTNISEAHKRQRLIEFYAPYQEALRNTIEETRARFGYAIFLDLHSFTPIWNGENRNVHIGTLACSDNFVEVHLAKYLTAACAAHDMKFAAHQPYNLKTMPRHRSAAARVIEEYGVWYTGLEIRNDLLSTPKDTKLIAELITEATSALTTYRDKMVFIKTTNSFALA